MGPGFKYHVVTISAIFFALTVGLIVGSLTFSPYVTRWYSGTLKGLKKTLDQDLNDKNQELDRLRRCLKVTVPLALKDKLAGRAVAIIQTGDYPEPASGVREALKLAGARVVSVTTTERVLARPDADLEHALAPLHDEDPRIPADRAGVAALLAAALVRGDSQSVSVLPLLERAELLTLGGEDSYQTPVTAVVMLAGSHEDTGRPALVDQPIVAALRKLGVTVVMCEPENAVVSDVPGYQALDVATVDDVDSDSGHVALVYALLGAKDDYGVKPTAHNLLPPAITSTLP